MKNLKIGTRLTIGFVIVLLLTIIMAIISSLPLRRVDHAQQANQLATSATDIAIRGGEANVRVVETMHQIDASAKKIEEIISVIDGIAFQTSLLPLNAAVHQQ
nr:methyl-accepting chemotaxis protein [Oxalobacter vibrioformis]